LLSTAHSADKAQGSLVHAHFVVDCFQRDEDHTALNMDRIYIGDVPSACDVSEELHLKLVAIYGTFVSPDGKTVDYEVRSNGAVHKFCNASTSATCHRRAT